MNNYSPEAAVEASKRNYSKYKLNVQAHETSSRVLKEHYAGVQKLGHDAVRSASRTEDATKYGIGDQLFEGKQLMTYQGDSLHEGALQEAAAAGVHIEVAGQSQAEQIPVRVE